MGPVITREHLERVAGYLEVGRREGATVAHDGRDAAPRGDGFLIGPSVLDRVAPGMRVAREEIFGPVLTIMTFRTPDEAVEKANNTMYGLSAGIWTDKGAKIFYMATKLKAGVIWGNTFNKFDPTSPFGGYKESGFGREGGRQGLSAYVEVE
jgi:aldehyde dehydrogenase (NAD+)